MTGRTHDLAAFTALTFVVASQPLVEMSLGTALVAFSANMIGGLAPDIDQPTSDLWEKLRGGSYLSQLIKPLIGGHRYISHSIVGILAAAFIMELLLQLSSSFLIVDIDVVWWAFMIGFISHLVMDTFTKDGVPWLFPIPIRFGIPPISFLRIKTGGIIEKSFVFPGLLFLSAYIIYLNYSKFIDFIKNYIR